MRDSLGIVCIIDGRVRTRLKRRDGGGTAMSSAVKIMTSSAVKIMTSSAVKIMTSSR